MSAARQPEVWLRGPVAGVPVLLQPVAHSLLQCREEVEAVLRDLTPDQLWAKPSGAASVGFHIRHAAGSLDRLFTYARGEALDERQLAALRAEKGDGPAGLDAAAVAAAVAAQVERAMAQLRATDESTLLDVREVGRSRLPSTVLGLLFHAAEHTQRHVGQTITTARIVGAD